jgi:hypothetical protein
LGRLRLPSAHQSVNEEDSRLAGKVLQEDNGLLLHLIKYGLDNSVQGIGDSCQLTLDELEMQGSTHLPDPCASGRRIVNQLGD